MQHLSQPRRQCLGELVRDWQLLNTVGTAELMAWGPVLTIFQHQCWKNNVFPYFEEASMIIPYDYPLSQDAASAPLAWLHWKVE